MNRPQLTNVEAVKTFVFEQSAPLAFKFAQTYGMPLEVFQEEWAKLSLLAQWEMIDRHLWKK